MKNFFHSKLNLLFLAVAIILFAWLQYLVWWGETGYFAQKEVEQQIERQQQINQELIERNRILFAEMDDLKTGMDVVEEYARLDLGLIKQNETFVQINITHNKELPKEFQNFERVNIAPMMGEIAPEFSDEQATKPQ